VDVTRPGPDEALTCLSALAASSGELYQRASQLSSWLATATERPAGGRSFEELLPLDKRLAVMEQISAAMRVLASDGYRFRRMQARALYAEGLTMAQLASVFGVSRQRVSALLRDTRDELPAQPDGYRGSGNRAAAS
jgi:hypothetical protein